MKTQTKQVVYQRPDGNILEMFYEKFLILGRYDHANKQNYVQVTNEQFNELALDFAPKNALDLLNLRGFVCLISNDRETFIIKEQKLVVESGRDLLSYIEEITKW